jgi:hypothetical protein
MTNLETRLSVLERELAMIRRADVIQYRKSGHGSLSKFSEDLVRYQNMVGMETDSYDFHKPVLHEDGWVWLDANTGPFTVEVDFSIRPVIIKAEPHNRIEAKVILDTVKDLPVYPSILNMRHYIEKTSFHTQTADPDPVLLNLHTYVDRPVDGSPFNIDILWPVTIDVGHPLIWWRNIVYDAVCENFVHDTETQYIDNGDSGYSPITITLDQFPHSIAGTVTGITGVTLGEHSVILNSLTGGTEKFVLMMHLVIEAGSEWWSDYINFNTWWHDPGQQKIVDKHHSFGTMVPDVPSDYVIHHQLLQGFNDYKRLPWGRFRFDVTVTDIDVQYYVPVGARYSPLTIGYDLQLLSEAIAELQDEIENLKANDELLFLVTNNLMNNVTLIADRQDSLINIINQSGKAKASDYINAGAGVAGTILDFIFPGSGAITKAIGGIIGRIADSAGHTEKLASIDWHLKTNVARIALAKLWHSIGKDLSLDTAQLIADNWDVTDYLNIEGHVMIGTATYIFEPFDFTPIMNANWIKYSDKELLNHCHMPVHGSVMIRIPNVSDGTMTTIYVGITGLDNYIAIIRELPEHGIQIKDYEWTCVYMDGHWVPVSNADIYAKLETTTNSKCVKMADYEIIAPEESIRPFIRVYKRYAASYNLLSYNCQHVASEIIGFLTDLRLPLWWGESIREEFLRAFH